jgi:hypothetical protein
MSDGKVRALCAQIALEINPEKADALIAQLKRLLNGENVDVNSAVTEELTVIDFATRSSDIRREIVDRATSVSSARLPLTSEEPLGDRTDNTSAEDNQCEA